MRSSHQATGQHQPRILRDARAAFLSFRGRADYDRRVAEIAALPDVTFKGKALKVLRCHGVRGKGPHDCNVPETVLWSLMGLNNFCCVFHHGDQLIGASSPVPSAAP
jgi:hypothetical protein